MNHDAWERIEQYLEGSLSKADLIMGLSLEETKALEADIEMVSSMNLAIETSELRTQIKKLPFNSEIKKQDKITSLRRWVVSAAAGIAILLGSMFLLKQYNSQDQYADYFYQEPGLSVVMGASAKYNFDDAMTYFLEGNYQIAEQKFIAISDAQSSVSDTLQYFIGASQFYQSRHTPSISSLQPVLDSNASSYYDRAQWLQILNYLEEDNFTKAKALLSKVASDDQHQFYTLSQQLLLQMK